jgi:hypothetical protein
MRTLLTALVLSFLATACDRVAYVYADGGPVPTTDAGPMPLADGAVTPDAGADVEVPPDGVCLPTREPGAVSSADCHRYTETPVCDGTTSACVEAPSHLCAACETDAQCRTSVDIRSECVFLPREEPYPSDQACLSPCETDDDCAWLPRPEWDGVRCTALPRGSYCVVSFGDPFNPGEPTCSDFHGGRRGDGI